MAVSAAQAQEPLACQNTLSTDLTDTLRVSPEQLADEDTIELRAGEFEATFGARPTAVVEGGVVLRRGDKVAGADSARYDPDQRAMLLDGNVRYEDPGTQILSDSAEFGYDSGRIQFTGAEFSLGGNNARGSAQGLLINQQGQLQFDDVTYTTCPPHSVDWELRAGDIDLDTREGVGTARNVKLRFKNIPILYAPYISFPISDARKTGVLTPEIGSTSRSGNELIASRSTGTSRPTMTQRSRRRLLTVSWSCSCRPNSAISRKSIRRPGERRSICRMTIAWLARTRASLFQRAITGRSSGTTWRNLKSSFAKYPTTSISKTSAAR